METGTVLGPAPPQGNTFQDHRANMGPWNWPQAFHTPSTLEATHCGRSLVSCLGSRGQGAGSWGGGGKNPGTSETEKCELCSTTNWASQVAQK